MLIDQVKIRNNTHIPHVEKFELNTTTPKQDSNNIKFLRGVLASNPTENVNSKVNIEDLVSIMSNLYERGSYDLGTEYAPLCKRLALICNDTLSALKIIEFESLCYYRLSKLYISGSVANDGIELGLHSNQGLMVSKLMIRLGWIQWRVYNYQGAKEWAQSGYKIWKDSDQDPVFLFDYHSLMAASLRVETIFEKSRFHGDSAIYYANLLNNNKMKGLALSNRSIQYPNDSDEEIEYRIQLIKQAISINEEMRDVQQLGSNYGVLSSHHYRNGDYFNAIKYRHIALRYINQTGELRELLYANLSLTRNYDSLRVYDKAYEHAILYQKYYKQIFNPEEVYNIHERSIGNIQNEGRKNLENLKYKNAVNEIILKKNQNKAILFSIFGGTLIGGVFFYFKKKQQNQMYNQLLSDDTRSKAINQLEINTLRTQMNPHFLFNSLNSIKSYIAKNEARKATKFINKFSSLIRSILEISKENFISIEEEINVLCLYIELEQLRFNESFDFELTIDNNIELDQYMMLPLIIQPFIENSIWHGLSHKDGKKILELEVNEIEDSIEIIIRDNGIGREASNKIRANRGVNHKSHGISITKERLKLSNPMFSEEKNIQVIDLYFKNGKPKGTEVTLKLPRVKKKNRYEEI